MTNTVHEELPDTVVAGKLLIPADDATVGDDLLRSAVDALGELDGEGFVGEGRLDRAYLTGALASSRVTLTLPQWAARDDDADSWLTLAVDSYHPKPFDVIFLNIHAGPLGAQIDLEWSVGLQLMPRLVSALNPTLAYLNAWTLDGAGGAFPDVLQVPPGAAPPVLTIWTYIGEATLTEELKDQLAGLPVPESAPLERGWSVRAVDHPQDAPAQAFLDALGRLSSDYLPPPLELTR